MHRFIASVSFVIASLPADASDDRYRYEVRIDRFPLLNISPLDEQVGAWEQAFRDGGMGRDNARKAAESARPSLEASSRPYGAKGTATITNSRDGLRIETFSAAAVRPGLSRAVPVSESFDAQSHVVRNMNGNDSLLDDPLLQTLKGPGDVLFLTGRLPLFANDQWGMEGNETATGVYYRSTPRVQHLVAHRDRAGGWASGVTEHGPSPNRGNRDEYKSNGKIDEHGPKPGYKLVVTRYFHGTNVAVETYAFERSREGTYRSLTADIPNGTHISDKRLGEGKSDDYTWSGSVPSLSELKTKQNPWGALGGTASDRAAGLAFGGGLLECGVLNLDPRPKCGSTAY